MRSLITDDRLLENLPLLVFRAGFVRFFTSIEPGGGGYLEVGTLKTAAFTQNLNLSGVVRSYKPSAEIS